MKQKNLVIFVDKIVKRVLDQLKNQFVSINLIWGGNDHCFVIQKY